MRNFVINAYNKKSHINREIYSNFAEHLGRCIYDGVFVGKDSPIPNVNGMRTDVVEALKNIKLPVLRWPGGCFADEYHWKDGIGPQEERKTIVNTNWGGVVEDNSFGTHEFFELCRQIGCEPYVNGNLGSGTVQEMSEWVEYMTCDGISPMAELRKKNGQEKPWNMRYFGVGNESWGCGGNMTADFYADQYRQYQTFVRNYGDNKVYKIACGTGTSPDEPNYAWTDTLMKKAADKMDGLSLHFYTLPNYTWTGSKGSALGFDEAAYFRTIHCAQFMETLVRTHGGIMDRYDPEKRVGLIVDEWGTWYDVEPGTNPGFLYQQNTMRDAIVASLTLDIFNQHSDRVHMANIAQLVNVLQALILTEGEKMLLTPTYHVFDLYKAHQDATLVDSWADNGTEGEGDEEITDFSHSASLAKDGSLTVTLTNKSLTNTLDYQLTLTGFDARSYEGKILTGKMDDHNSFDAPNEVHPVEYTGLSLTSGGGTLSIPPCSVVLLTLKK